LAPLSPNEHGGREGALPRQAPAREMIDGSVEDLATWTGGAFFYASTPADTSNASRQVLEELRQQYVIAFEPAASKGWRPLEIRTRDKDYVVRTRSGYMAGPLRRATPGEM